MSVSGSSSPASAAATRRTLPGSGLGLSFCQRIMNAHGGKVAVADRPGEGAAFGLEFPAPASPSPRGGAAGVQG